MNMYQTNLYYSQGKQYKSGGRLTKNERIEIEREKANLKAKQKVVELTYRAILHNNEMLQKSLIKVFN